MKKIIFVVIALILTFFAAPSWGLSIHTFILENETNEEVYVQYESGTLVETAYFTEEDVMHENDSRLGFLFDLEDSYPGGEELYVDLSTVFDGVFYEHFSNINYSTYTENFNDNSFLIIYFSAYNNVDLSLLTDVTFTGHYGNEAVSATMYFGEEPSVDPIPEPATFLLLGSGLMGIIGLRRKM